MRTTAKQPFPKTELARGRGWQGSLLSACLKADRGHWGPLEHPSLSLMIQADHNTMMQLRTHRVGCTFDYQSMRYTPVSALAKLLLARYLLKTFFTFVHLVTTQIAKGKKYEWTKDQA